MAKQIATTKQTSGGGYYFEDQVGAQFLLKMLAGIPILRPEDGLLQSVCFQKRVDDWFLDDLVLEMTNASGFKSHFALSIKSNSQLTQEGFPAEFTEAIWEHRYHKGTSKFEPTRDFLGLITATVANNVKNAWNSLLKKARAQWRAPQKLVHVL